MFSKKINFNISWQVFFAAAMFAVFLLQLLGLIAPQRENDLFNAYGLVCIAACAGIYFSKKGVSGPWEIKLFIAYLAWVLVTRWLNRDFYLHVDFDFVITVLLSFLLFAIGPLLNIKQRETLLDIFSLIYAGFFVLVSIAGIFITVTNTYIHLPPEDAWITVTSQFGPNNLNLLSCPPAIGAGRVFMAWTLLIYQLLKRKNICVKALLIFSIIILHITMPLFHNRNTQIVLCMCYGMLALLYAIKFFRKKSKAFKAVVFPVITAVALVACFLSFNWSNTMISKIYTFSAPRFESFYDGLESKLNPDYFGVVLSPEELAELSELDTTPSKAVFSAKPLRAVAEAENVLPSQLSAEGKMTDSRNIFENVTLSERTYIWQSGILAVKQNPSIALFGRLTNNFMDLINKILVEQVEPSVTEYKNHMHNVYMQVLMLTGIPGLLLIVFWTILMVKNMIKVFFSKSDCLAVKSLTIPIAGMLVYNLLEVVIFGKIDIIGMCFFILAGIFIGYYYDSSCQREV